MVKYINFEILKLINKKEEEFRKIVNFDAHLKWANQNYAKLCIIDSKMFPFLRRIAVQRLYSLKCACVPRKQWTHFIILQKSEINRRTSRNQTNSIRV